MKKYICIILILSVLMSFAGCHISALEDSNGESDFTLQTITEQDILEGMSTTTFMSSSVTLHNTTTYKAKTMSGVKELLSVTLDNEPLDMVVSCEITNGNARLVLVVNDEIVHDFALNERNQRFSLEMVSGEVSLKLAGESCGYAVTCTLQ